MITYVASNSRRYTTYRSYGRNNKVSVVGLLGPGTWGSSSFCTWFLHVWAHFRRVLVKISRFPTPFLSFFSFWFFFIRRTRDFIYLVSSNRAKSVRILSIRAYSLESWYEWINQDSSGLTHSLNQVQVKIPTRRGIMTRLLFFLVCSFFLLPFLSSLIKIFSHQFLISSLYFDRTHCNDHQHVLVTLTEPNQL